MEQLKMMIKKLLKPLEWLSFLYHDLPILVDISRDVKRASILNGLNRSNQEVIHIIPRAPRPLTAEAPKFIIPVRTGIQAPLPTLPEQRLIRIR